MSDLMSYCPNHKKKFEGWGRDCPWCSLAKSEAEVASLKETVEVLADETGTTVLRRELDDVKAKLEKAVELLGWWMGETPRARPVKDLPQQTAKFLAALSPESEGGK